jgi:hypothetical protein
VKNLFFYYRGEKNSPSNSLVNPFVKEHTNQVLLSYKVELISHSSIAGVVENL